MSEFTSSESDSEFLDSLFESALGQIEDGQEVKAQEFMKQRPGIEGRILEAIRTAREVANTKQRTYPQFVGYSLLAELGRGGMGTVYLARQRSLGDRLVALKVLPTSDSFSSRARDRFKTEARAIARLRHPNVVAIHDVIHENGVHAYAMEWVDGKSLAQLIEQLQTLPLENREVPLGDVFTFLGSSGQSVAAETATVYFCRLGIAIARALGAVHREDLTHRDVKPSNILLRRDGTPLLTDFGLARETDTTIVTQTGHFVGTPAYASPEQLRGDQDCIDGRSDVYSLGATLYHALTLHVPFSGRTPTELLDQIESGKMLLLRTRHRRFSRDLETIIAKAMEPSPERRYATADELADDLERLLNLQPIKAKPATLATRTWKAVRRNRASLVGVLIGSVMALSLAAAVAVYFLAIPRWVKHHIDQARLTLLHPEQSNQIFTALFWNQPHESMPSDSLHPLARALDHYQAAIRLSPFDDELRKERDVVRRAIDTLSQSASDARDQGDAWAFSNDPRSQGLFELLTGDAAGALDEWSKLDPLTGSDPFVETALGVLHLANGEPARAYPRLQRAVEAFPNVSFLTQYLADAAIQCGDLDRAERLIERGRKQALPDKFSGLDRVAADLYAALGRDDDAIALYKAQFVNNPIAEFNCARLFESRGRFEEAVHLYARVLRRVSSGHRSCEAFVRVMEKWWSSFSDEQHLDLVRRSLDEGGVRGESVAALLRTYVEAKSVAATQFGQFQEFPTLSTQSSSPYLQRDSESLITLAGKMEVSNLKRWNCLIKLPTVLKNWLAESWVSPTATVKGSFAEWCGNAACALQGIKYSLRRPVGSPRPFVSSSAPHRRPPNRSLALSALIPIAALNGAALANPVVPGFTVDTHASLTVPMALTFDTSGVIYVANDVGSGFIRRIDVDGVVTDYGSSAIFDPDALTFDATGAVSGVPGSVLVGGWSGSGTDGVIYAVWPDQSVHTLFGPTPDFQNPIALIVDPLNRLIMIDGNFAGVSTGGRLMIADGGVPVTVFSSTPGMVALTVAPDGKIFTSDTNGLIRLHNPDGTVLDPDYASFPGNMDLGPGDAAWGNDLYVLNPQTDQLVRVDSTGIGTVIGTGFIDSVQDVRFGPDGALYLSIYEGRILRIAPRCSPGFHGLGDLPGGANYSLATAVSADGTTVVGYSVSSMPSPPGLGEAFRWRTETGMVGIGDLPGADATSIAYGVSGDGSAIVGWSSSGNGNFGSRREEAFRWTQASGTVGLGDLPGGFLVSSGYHLSDDGLTTFGFAYSGEFVAAVWKSASGWSAIDPLGGYSVCSGGSRNGQWATGSRGGSTPEAFRWSSTTGFEIIGELPGGAVNGAGYSASDAGTVAGVSLSANGTEAMFWTPANGMVGLGDLPGGAFTSEAIGISADGSLIVGYGTTDLGEEAVLWDESLTIHRIADYLATQGVQVPAGWLLQRAYDTTMNCCATTIVGYGLNPNGDPEAWMANFTPDPLPTCNDGNACTINDTCSAGSCSGTPIDCSSLNDTCNVGVCNSGNGQCQTMPANNGGACDDNNSCTTDDVCSSGVCAGTLPPWGDVHPVGAHNGVVNLDDILCVLNGFTNPATCPDADLKPCVGNGVVNLDDILGVLAAFGGANQCPCMP